MTYSQVQQLLQEGETEKAISLLAMNLDEARGDIEILKSSKKKEDEDACRRQSKVNEGLSPQSPSLSNDDRSVQKIEDVRKEILTSHLSMVPISNIQNQLNDSSHNIKTFG